MVGKPPPLFPPPLPPRLPLSLPLQLLLLPLLLLTPSHVAPPDSALTAEDTGGGNFFNEQGGKA